MNKFWPSVAAAILLPAVALAQTTTITWTKFIDPSENAFAVEVPQGWTTTGGTKRFAPLVARLWMTAVSPDGTTQVFYGDPDVPNFTLPQGGQAEGSAVPARNSQFAPTVAMSYRPGAEFAKFYAPRSLVAVGCTGAVMTGAQAMPDLARAQMARAADVSRGTNIRGGYTPSQHDAGIATFTCQSQGQAFAAGVIADTGQPGAAGIWGVPVLAGYLTTPDQAPLALAVLSHLLGSRQWNPQWDQAMRDQLQQALTQQNMQADRFMMQMQQQSQQWSEMLYAQCQANHARLTANHNAFMGQMNRQSEINNENFRLYQAQRSLNSWNFDAHIRNGELYRDLDTGRIFEVDH